LSARTVLQVFDDDDDGTPDPAAIAMLIDDASSYVLEFYYGNHKGVDISALDVPKALRRMALDVAHAYLAIRHAEYVRADGYKMMERIDKELGRMRDAYTRIADAPPDPPHNAGGAVGVIGDDAMPETPEGFFDNMGDWT